MLKHLAFVCIVVVAFVAKSVRGDVVIQVDVSDPSAVTLTSLDVNAENNDSSGSTFRGVTLEDFFDPGTTLTLYTLPSDTRSLTPAGGASPYTSLINRFGNLQDTDLNIYGGSPTATQQFSTLTRAFTGASIANLSGRPLPSPGMSGNIIVGDRSVSSSGTVIGQWAAVPEPSAFLYGGIVCLLAVCGRRLKR